MKSPVPGRGDIWLVNFDPSRGSEQEGIQPALMIQNDVGNRYPATTIVAAITTTLKEYPVTVRPDRKEGGLDEPSMASQTQVPTLDESPLVRRLGSISQARLNEVDAALLISLGIGS